MSKKDNEWKCSCGWVLGYIEDENTVRIRFKDRYVLCKGGEVTTTCFRCAALNVVKLYTTVSDPLKLRRMQNELLKRGDGEEV